MMGMRTVKGGATVGVRARIKTGLGDGAFKGGGEAKVLISSMLIGGEAVKGLLIVYNKAA